MKVEMEGGIGGKGLKVFGNDGKGLSAVMDG